MVNSKQKVLIVGAGAAGKELLAELRKNLKEVFEIVGFVDDDLKKINKYVNEIKVLGTTASLESLIRKHQIKEVFIALPSAQGEVIRKIVDKCSKQKVVFKIIPRILEIVLGKVKLPQLREVRIEDLLGRSIIRSDQQKFFNYFKDKKILITGAAGSIGSELCRQLTQFKVKKIICLDIWENGLFELESQFKTLSFTDYEVVIANIQDSKKIRKIFNQFKPEIIFHAAAFKHVPLMQIHPEEAVKNNVFGTLNLSQAAARENIKKFVNISTDKAADPSSVMGTSKLIAEKIIQNQNRKSTTKFISVRFGNVLDSNGSVIPTFRRQIQSGGPVTITHPRMTRFFMTIPEAVQLVLEAAIMGEGGEVFVLDMGQPVNIEQMARLLINLSGFIPDKEIKIKYIGARPGEKLEEILFTDKEILENTANEKIFKIRQNNEVDGKLTSLIKRLDGLTSWEKRKELINFLKMVAPNLQT